MKKIKSTSDWIQIKIIALVVLLCFQNFIFAQSDVIPFEQITLKEALEKAGQNKQLVFIDAFTTWCGPCKWMAKNVFTNDEVAKFYGSNFVCLKLDMEKGEGKEFAEKYEVSAYPTFVFLNATGIKVHQACGSKEAPDFILDGKNALTPELNLLGYQERFNQGQRDFTFLREYAHVLAQANMSSEDVLNELLDSESKMDLINKKDFELLANYCSLNSKAFEFIGSNQEKYKAVLDKDRLENLYTDVFLTEAYNAGKSNDVERLKIAEKTAEKFVGEKSGELTANMRWNFARVTKTNMYDAAKDYADNYLKNNASELNNLAWAIYENYEDPKVLKSAADWAAQSVKIKQEYANTDTYANILHKMGKEEEAARYANTAIDMAKKLNLDYSDTENLLKEIESKKQIKK